MSALPAHPFGHGRPPSPSEQARFADIVADLSGDRPVDRRRSSPTVEAHRARWLAWLARRRSI
jgi:hypothetical protein